MGDQGHGHDSHKHEHGHKKGGFLNKLFARQGSLKLGGGGHGEREEEEEGRTSSPTRRPDEHPHPHYRFHFPASPLGSSAPTFPSLRHLTGAGVKATEAVGRGGGDKGSGGLEKGGKGVGGGGGRGGGKVNSQRLLSPLTPSAVAAMKIALDYLGSTALGEEGLYRVSGNKLDVDRLKAVLAAGLLVSSDTLQAHYPDKHVIAGAIKKVLQEHEPLLGYHLYADFVSASAGPAAAMLDEDKVVEEGEEEEEEEGMEGRRRRGSNLSNSDASSSGSSSGSSRSSSSGGLISSSSSSKEGRYRVLVLQLRPTSRELLGHLLRHLRRVVARSEENKMTAENLAVTVGLNLLRKSESVAGVSIQQLERERLVIMDLIALSPSLFPLDGMGNNKTKAHPPPKPFHGPRLINSAPASRTPRHFFSLTDEMARRTALLPATGGGEDDRDGDVVAPPLFLKPPPKPLGRPHQETNSGSGSTTTTTASGSSRPKAISINRSSSSRHSSGGGESGRVAEARTNPLASTLRPPEKPLRASPRRASSNESAATSSPALSVSSCNLSTEGKEDEGGGVGREGNEHEGHR